MGARVVGTIIAAMQDRIRAPTLTARKLLRLEVLLPPLELKSCKKKSKPLSNEKEIRWKIKSKDRDEYKSNIQLTEKFN